MKVRDFSGNIAAAHRTNSMILPNGELYCMDGISTRLNNNVLIMGASGAGKTRGMVIPNLLAAVDSYIVSDPKGILYKNYSKYMRDRGYRVAKLDLIHPERSARYNPLSYVRSTNDVLKLAHQIVYGSGVKRGGNYDPYWDRAACMLLSALIGYFLDGGRGVEFSLQGIIRLMSQIDVEAVADGETCEIDTTFNLINHKHRAEHGEDCWSYMQYKKFKNLARRTNSCVIGTLHAILADVDTKELREMLKGNELDIRSVGERKTAIFVEVSDTDRSKDTLANIFYSQAMNVLCSYADEECVNGRLPVPVRFILDDFGTNCRIDGFESMISNIRSRNISATIILQSIAQLEAGYNVSAHTIMDNCDTQVYLGGNDLMTASDIAKKCNKSLTQVMGMPLSTNLIFRRGEQAMFSQTVDLSEYDTELIPVCGEDEDTELQLA